MRSYFSFLVLIIVLPLLTLSGLPSKATVNQYTEDFTTTQYKDALQTTAWWDTVAGEMKLHPFEITLVGSYDTPTIALEVAVQGDYAFLTESGHPGLIVFDISNPTNPLCVASLDFPQVAERLVISGNYAYVGLAMSAGLYVVDITDPTTPFIAGSYIGLPRNRHLAVNGDYLYVAAGGGGVAVLDVSNPANPSLLGSCGGLGYVYIISNSGDYVFATSEYYGLYILDVSNPTNPHVIGGYPTSVPAASHAVSGDRCYIRGGAPDRALIVLDITDPTSPVLVGGLDTPGDLGGDFDISGDYLFAFELVGSTADLLVIDISDPSNPIPIDSYDMNAPGNTITLFGEYAFIAAGTNGIKVLKIAEAVTPTLVANCDTPFHAHDVAISGNYAYVADWEGGFQVIDISDPTNPTLAGGCGTPGYATGVAVDGDYAYLGDYTSLQVIDISDPTNPTKVGSYSTSWNNFYPVVHGDLVYLPDGEAGVTIFDVSDPTNPLNAGGYDTPGNAYHVAFAGDYAYVADHYAGVQVLDVSNPTNPTYVASYDTPGYSMWIVVSGDHAFVADWESGVHVFDISDPANPTIVGSYDTAGKALRLTLSGDYLYVGEWLSGVQILDVSDPTNPVLVASYDTSGDANTVVVSGDYAFVGDGPPGLKVLQVYQRQFNTLRNIGQSLAIDESEELILKARLTSTQVESVNWELSADGGSNWMAVQPDNTWHTFASPGSDLLWRSSHVLTDPSTNPTCTSLSIEWESLPAIAFDIKPRSCPNPFNITWFEDIDIKEDKDHPKKNKGGVMPAAIVGSGNFDVTEVDISTLLLEGVAPLRSSFEDVTRPATGGDDCACTTGGPDGFMDLTLKFNCQKIAAAIGPAEDGDVVALTITGSLQDGTPFEASDCVTILSKHPAPLMFEESNEVQLAPPMPNPFNPVTRVAYWLPEKSFVKLCIYDVAGRLVDQLMEDVQSRGEHVIEWDASGIASGTYFLRLEVGNEVRVRRVTLLK
ncbi:MAG: T9SS type A sorting domain-containing protein [Candidatus Latescibacteria bacterium]|nr:T9SS type A sorting domain-containing protein [Candidatus Latescibacterota bacterium]NIO55202.1 T9SS type A sorting domain-containing protein [Candidatus Latescibacterota bacterium]